MHISILLMEQIIELFIMILMGFIIVKAGIVKDEDSKVLSLSLIHISEPTRQAEISYAVFCLKKKKKNKEIKKKKK